MNKYNDSKIYKIVDNTSDKVYIGSTCCKYLSQRLQKHVHTNKHYLKNNYNYVSSFDIIQNGNYDIVLLENVNCDTIEQLRARERFHIESNVCVNKRIPTRTKKEFWKVYSENNRAELNEKSKIYKEENPEKRKTTCNEWYHRNKETVLEKDSIRFECECGSNIRCCDK